MIGLDTNVIARIVLADDPAQTQQAMAALEQARAAGETVVLGLPTLLELEWVLRAVAKLPKATVLRVFKNILETQDLQIDRDGLYRCGKVWLGLRHDGNHLKRRGARPRVGGPDFRGISSNGFGAGTGPAPAGIVVSGG